MAHPRQRDNLPATGRMIGDCLHLAGRNDVNLRQNGWVAYTIQKTNEDQEMTFPSSSEIIHRPTGLARKPLHVHGDGITCRPDSDNIYRLLVSECEVGIRTEAMQHGQNVKLSSEICVVGRHPEVRLSPKLRSGGQRNESTDCNPNAPAGRRYLQRIVGHAVHGLVVVEGTELVAAEIGGGDTFGKLIGSCLPDLGLVPQRDKHSDTTETTSANPAIRRVREPCRLVSANCA